MMRKLVLLLTLFFAATAFGLQQNTAEPSKPAASEPASREHEAAASEHSKSTDGKAAQPDVHTQFTQSASVKKMGDMLGISTKNASRLAFFFNFAVVVLAIWWLGRSGIPQMFRDRTAAIQRGIEEARKASEESSAKLSEIEARLSRLDEEIATMRAEADESGRSEEHRLAAATEEEKRKIVESAEQEITAAASNARRELKAFAAELAVGLAEKKISVDAATDKSLIRDFSASLNDGGKGQA